MIGPYEIEHEGRKYFGNVQLREFHVFSCDGDLLFVDVGKMTARQITPRTAAAIRRAASPFCDLIPESVMLELRALDLATGAKDDRPDPPPAGEPAESTGKVKFPVVNISLFLAQECNMRCIYCYGDGGGYAGKGMMSQETALKAVDWLMANAGSEAKVQVSFFGGEPLLNFPLMKKVVPYARARAAEKGKQISFGMTTNGSVLTDEIISFLKDEKIDFLLSFDGPPEVQNRQRPFRDGSGSYDAIRANIRKLRAVFPHVAANAVLCEDADPFRIEEGIKQAGITFYNMASASPVLLKRTPAGMTCDGSGERLLQRMLAFYRDKTAELHTAILERTIDEDRTPIMLFEMEPIVSGRKRHHGCAVGKGMVGISVAGDIFPCHRFVGLEEMCMGNIADYRAGELTAYHRAVVDRHPECRTCWARYYCGGGCLYHNKAYTGDPYRPHDLFCREKRAVIEGLIHVYCRLNDHDKEYLKDALKRVEAKLIP